MQSDPICSSAGCTQYKHPKKKLHPMNYPVPNFGRDGDINDSFHSLEIAEAQRQHHWDFQFKKPPPVNPAKATLYDFAPKLDGNIIDSQRHEKDAESRLGTWDLPSLVQMQSDPWCPSSGCDELKSKKEKDNTVYYPDPDNMALDGDIVDTKAHLQGTEKRMGKTWTLKAETDPYTIERTGSKGPM